MIDSVIASTREVTRHKTLLFLPPALRLVPNFTEGRVKEVARILEPSESLIDDLWRLAV